MGAIQALGPTIERRERPERYRYRDFGEAANADEERAAIDAIEASMLL